MPVSHLKLNHGARLSVPAKQPLNNLNKLSHPDVDAS